MSTFNGLEIMKIAILMEEEGSKFYTECAKNAEGKVKDFLLIAAGQEFVHKDKFQKIYNDLSSSKDEDYSYLFDDETNAYLKALIENQVFDKNKQPMYGFKKLKTALEYAVKSEKHTIEVYTKMYSGIKNDEVKAVLAELIEEEKTHAEYFQRLADELA